MSELELCQLKERIFELILRNVPGSSVGECIKLAQDVVDWIITVEPTEQDLENILNDFKTAR
jgi:hypothetical protein